ncbi:hypothetical protein FB451DRAFT_1206485 [Mycena latifolia]|nr:hypothetical protein FB451DRAFT_1206485 [Mycena latifolia]
MARWSRRAWGRSWLVLDVVVGEGGVLMRICKPPSRLHCLKIQCIAVTTGAVRDYQQIPLKERHAVGAGGEGCPNAVVGKSAAVLELCTGEDQARCVWF